MNGVYLVTRAMRKLGALDSGRQPTGQELQDGIDTLNHMVDAWAGIQAFVPFYTIFRQLTPSSKVSYTVGPGGDFNTVVRPVDIKECNIVFNQGPSEVHLPVTLLKRKEWLGIPVQLVSTQVPVKAYYDQGFISTPGIPPATATAGLGTIYINPFPGPPLPDLEFTYSGQIAQFDQTTDYLFKPGFAEAIELSLAERLWELAPPDMNRAQLRELAAEARAVLTANNPDQPPRMASDAAGFGQGRGRGGFNWTTGNIA